MNIRTFRALLSLGKAILRSCIGSDFRFRINQHIMHDDQPFAI